MDRYYDIWTTVSDCWGLELETGDMATWKKEDEKSWQHSATWFFVLFFPSITPVETSILITKAAVHCTLSRLPKSLVTPESPGTRTDAAGCPVVGMPAPDVLLSGWGGLCLQPRWKWEHWWKVVRWTLWASRRFELLRICAKKKPPLLLSRHDLVAWPLICGMLSLCCTYRFMCLVKCSCPDGFADQHADLFN